MPADWDNAKIKAEKFNSRALNALFNVVTNKEFKKISSIETAKEAWTILQTTYEGIKAVKDSKLQRLTTSFEEIKMKEDQSFDEFYAKLKDIVNSTFNIGETISEPKIVRNVLRSLPKRFHAKITAVGKFRPQLIEITSFKPKLLIRLIMNKLCSNKQTSISCQNHAAEK